MVVVLFSRQRTVKSAFLWQIENNLTKRQENVTFCAENCFAVFQIRVKILQQQVKNKTKTYTNINT